MQIKKIEVCLTTGNEDSAGTNGEVYLGICGREFYLDADRNDFEKGDYWPYILGDAANILHKQYNDPRKFWPRHTEDLEKFPVYIRFEPRRPGDPYDNWLLEQVTVKVNPGPGEWTFEALAGEGVKLWLGLTRGKICYLELVEKGED